MAACGQATVTVPAAPGPVVAVPPDGVLEEMDGRPIGRPSVRGLHPGDALPGPGVPWRRGAAAATVMTARRPSLWVYALVAFLARGGIVVLALPIVVAPTFIGLANFVGPASVSAGGPGPRLIALMVVGLAAAAALVVVGACVAAAAEVALHRATAATPEAQDGRRDRPGRSRGGRRHRTGDRPGRRRSTDPPRAGCHGCGRRDPGLGRGRLSRADGPE